MLIRRLLTAAAAAVLMTFTFAGAARAADGGGVCQGPDCGVWADQPASSSGGGGNGGGGGGGGCHFRGQTVPCTIASLGWFSSRDGCYYLLDAVAPPLVGDLHVGEEGHFYEVTCGMYDGGPVTSETRWVPGAALPAPPDPETLARHALAKITLKGADISMNIRPGGAGLVNLPVWLWTQVTANTWGPLTASDTEGGLTVNITAQAQRIVWDMGDGNTKSCAGPGTPFTAGHGGRRSPTCDYTYSTPSRNQPGGAYTVTATTFWQVAWVAGGATGVINQTRTSTTTVKIDELQVVNR